MFTKKEPRAAKKQRLKIHETTLENDIRYRGPLSFQHFQWLGWLCIVASQAVILLQLGARLDEQFAMDTAGVLQLLQNVAGFSLPFLLIANFAQIIDASAGYRKQLIKNIAAAAAICGVFYLFFYRYYIGGIEALIDDPSQALPIGMKGVNSIAKYGFYDFNIFIDLLLCTLVMLFMNYRPKRVFTGKWVHVFRAFALLPIAYEVCCMVLKIRAATGRIEVPVWVYPLLTVKPPMTFVLFIILALFVKTRELRFRRHGKTHEEYEAFLQTRRNAWHFSVFLAIMIVVVSIIDFGVVLGVSVGEGVSSLMTNMESLETSTDEAYPEPADGIPAALEASAIASPDASAPIDASASIDAGASPDASVRPNASALPDASASINASASPDAADAALTPTEGPGRNGHALTDEEKEAAIQEYIESDEMMSIIEKSALISMAVGFGGSMNLIMLAPFVLLFCYTRKPKYPWISLLIPLAGIVLIVLVYFEGSHQLLFALPFKRISVEELMQYQMLMDSMLM